MPLIRNAPESPKKPSTADRPDDLRSALASSNADDRWNAARVAAEQPDSVPDLAHALMSERDARVREAMFTALARIATSDSIAAVIPYVRSDDSNVRTGALDALRAMPALTEANLPQLLSDPDPDVRLLACDLARVMTGAAAPRLLASLIETDLQNNVCGAAVEVLAEIGDESSLPSLAICATRFPSDAFLNFAIKMTIGRLTGRPVRG